MPALLIEAQRVAHTVTHGSHGRRRAGPGETFWQFRHFDYNDSRSGIDWRRSGSSDHLFVREREWEAAHTVWLWVDLSPSMQFRSRLSNTTKESRAVVLSLALSELLARAGERVGVLGSRPYTGRSAARRVAEVLVGDAGKTSLPPPARLSRFSECLLFSDFLEPVEETAKRIEAIAAQGVRGHLVQILDPAEETLPYEGRTEFSASEGRDRVIAGRAENLRERYRDRLGRELESVRWVHLKGDFELIKQRIDARKGHYMTAKLLESQFAALELPRDAIRQQMRPAEACMHVSRRLKPERRERFGEGRRVE